MKVLEQFLRPTQRQLFKLLCNMFEDKTHVSDNEHRKNIAKCIDCIGRVHSL